VKPLRRVTAALAIAASCTPGPAFGEDRGSWDVVWRYDEAIGVVTDFKRLSSEGHPFPFTWKHWNDTRGNRLQFLNEIGAEIERIDLGPGENAWVSDNAQGWIIVSPDPTAAGSHIIHSYRRGSRQPLWEAFTAGDPLLFSGDGDALVLATRDEHYDRMSRLILDGRGRLQVIAGESGVIRGELPIYPTFVRSTGDGQGIALLHDRELFVLKMDGRLAWKTDVPLDNMVAREGLSHLATASDLIVVCGTGEEASPRGLFNSIHPRRHENLLVFNTSGRLLWQGDALETEVLRFNFACAISPDGSTIATIRDTERDQMITIYEARTGEKISEHHVKRRSGSRTLSLTPGGELTCLASSDMRTGLTAWNRNGDIVWDGVLPLRSMGASVHAGNLLVAEQWIVRLVPEVPEE